MIENVRLMLMDDSEVVIPLADIKDLVTTYSFVRDKCYEFKVFVKDTVEGIEIVKENTIKYVAFEYDDCDVIEAVKVPFKEKNGINTAQRTWDAGDGFIGIHFKYSKEGK